MKKTFFVLNRFLLILFGLLFTSLFGFSIQQLNHPSDLTKNNTSINNEAAKNVTDVDGFFEALNADEDISIQADLDFGGVPIEDYGIDNYTGSIEGNNHVLSNRTNYLLDGAPVPLFKKFNGTAKNLIFDDFAFFAGQVGDESDNVLPTEMTFENIQLRNITISGIDKVVSTKSNPITQVPIGIFINEAHGIKCKNISIINSKMIDNHYQIIDDGSSTDYRNELAFGYFIGVAFYSVFEEIYVLNSTFENNYISTLYSNSSETSVKNDQNPFTLSFFIGNTESCVITDSFLNNNSVVSNTFKVGRPRIAGISGYSRDTTYERIYQVKYSFSNNTFFSYEAYSNRLGNIIGYDNTTTSSIKDVTVEGIINTGNIGNEVGTSERYDVTIDDFAYIDASTLDNDYYILDEDEKPGTSNISYINEDAIDLDFWKTTVGFSSKADIWNLSALIENDLSISQDGNGYPVFETMVFLNNEATFIDSELVITFQGITPEGGGINSITLKSIFGDTYVIDKGTQQIKTGISEDMFQGKDQAEITNALNEWYWIEYDFSNQNLKTVLSGDILNLSVVEYVEPDFTIDSAFGTPNGGYETLVFDYSIKNENLIYGAFDQLKTFQLKSQYDNQTIELDTQNTVQIPSYVSDLNTYYELIFSNLNYQYLTKDKKIVTKSINVNGEITNIATEPQLIKAPQIDITSAVNSEDKTIDIKLNLSDNSFYKEDEDNLKTSVLKVKSSFNDLNGTSNEISLNLSDFTKIDPYHFETTITYQSDVDAFEFNNFYALEFSSTLEYYNDFNFGTDQISAVNYSGDFTNSDLDSIQKYDDSLVFDGAIQTSIIDNNIIISLNYTFPYLVSYDINLVLKSSNGTNKINFTETSAKEVKIALDSNLIKYYDSLSEEEKLNFDINDYYSLDYDQNQESTLFYINSMGIKIEEKISFWNTGDDFQTLDLSGVIINTDESTLIEIPQMKNDIFPWWWIVLSIAILILLIRSNYFNN